MLIAGDLANNYEVVLETLYEIERLSRAKCLFVPGNHDIWTLKHQDKSSWEIYQALQTFSGNLTREPFHLNEEWVVIGEMGWYDYSFGSSRFTVQEFDEMEHNEMLWQDKFFAQWGRPTREVCQYFYHKMQRQLDEFADKKIITLTHVVPHPDFIVQSTQEMWQYFNAFLGSKAYGELFLHYPVKYAVFGHVHYRQRRVYGETTFICNSLGYNREWYQEDPAEEVARAFVTIEIS